MSAEPRISKGLRELLREGKQAGAFKRGHLWVAQGGRCISEAWTPECHPQSLWDVASLTKPMAVVTEVMRGVAAGELSLEDKICTPAGFESDLRSLLAHRSGLPPWDDLWQLAQTLGKGWLPGSQALRERVEQRIAELAGTQEGSAYSDLGFITLGWHLEARFGKGLSTLVSRWRWGVPASSRAYKRTIATGHCPRRGRQARGEVDDLNTWVLGGVAGHAGLFASAREVGAWALDLSNAAAGRGGSIDGGVVRSFWDPAQKTTGSSWVLGWDTPTPPNSTAGTRVSSHAVGHLGFTGTSVWIDRESDLIVVLLSDRVALGADAQPLMRALRPRIHDGVRDLLGL